MAITFRSAHSANATSVAITTPAIGDFILVLAYNSGATLPTLATGYTPVVDIDGLEDYNARVGWKVSDGTETTSGTWTSATSVAVYIARGVSTSTPIGAFDFINSTSDVEFPGLSLVHTDSSSWVIGLAGAHTSSGMDGTGDILSTNRTHVQRACVLDGGGSAFFAFAGDSFGIDGGASSVGFAIEILVSTGASLTASDSESATAIDAPGSVLQAAGSNTESATASSSQGTVFSGVGAASEAASAADVDTAAASLGAAGSEAASATESDSGAVSTTSSASESASASESDAAAIQGVAADAESASASESEATTLSAVASDTEAATAATASSTVASFIAADSESASAISTQSGVDSDITGASEAASAEESSSAVSTHIYLDSISVVKVQDGALGATGANGVGFTLSNEAQAVPSLPDGTSPVLTGSNGQVSVNQGGTDVTSSATIGSVTATGCTGTVNTATNSPVAGHPKGYYVVTAMSADTATLDIPITFGTTSVTLRFSLTKTKSAKGMSIISDRQVITYDGTGALSPSVQLTTFSAQKINTTATVTWTMTQLDGTALTASTYLSATTGDSVTMSAANFNTARGSQLGVVVIGTLSDGVTISDKISMIKVAAGADGVTGATGPSASAVLAAQNVLAGIGNRVLIGPTTTLAAALGTGGTSISVIASVFANGDVVIMQTAPGGTAQTEFLTITSSASGTGPYSYNVTRNLDGSGADSWSIGDVLVGLGQTGSSFIDIYATRGTKSSSEHGPAIAFNVRNSGTYNDWTPRGAIGNLNGVFGYSSDIYGAAFGVPSGPWLKIDPTNGVRIGHNATTKVQIDPSGNAVFTGAIIASDGTIGGWTISASDITGGATVLHSNGHVEFGTKLTWDGTTLTLTGTIHATDGVIGPWTLGSSGIVGTFIQINESTGAIGCETMGAAQHVTAAGYFDTFTSSGLGEYRVNGVKVLGSQGAAIADATDSASAITRVNLILARMRAHGSIAT